MASIKTEKSATLADVARVAGVSKGTASNVFNRPGIVREEVRERVLKAAATIGYHGPDPKGRLLSAGKVNAIGVATMQPLATFFTDPYERVLMTSIAEECDANGIGVSLICAASGEQLAWNMRSAVVDGFILFCLHGAEPLIAQSLQRQLPFVALDHGDDKSIPSIDIDNIAGARAAAAHLAELGHRQFAILAMEFSEDGFGLATPERIEETTYLDTRDRVTGYRQALKEHGIDPNSAPVFETWSDRETVYAALDEIYAAPSPPTAILAQSDVIAFLAMDWLRQHALAVPGDVSIVGFDGVPESAKTKPPLTTVQQPIAEIGRRAVRAILDNRGETVRETLDVELVVRGSTAPPRDRATTP
ncbi:MAG: LacI family DNA-binding transcriptional regulator [Rhizobiaceae bacterium]